MRAFLFLFFPALVLALSLAGCSKKAPAAEVGEAAATNTTEQAEQPAEPVEESPAEMAAERPETEGESVQAADISTVPQSLQSQDYDAAVDSLAAAGKSKMTVEQQQAYNAQLYRTLDALRQKAETDARAQQAYERMGKKMMGR